jgi:8-oxo-dGTP pyrophosphatase MutT (NUDIX family)
MAPGQWYPPEWPERIRALMSGELTVAAPRRAATVMLLRDEPETGSPPSTAPVDDVRQPRTGPGEPADRAATPVTRGLAVHMLRRRTSMPFAAGAYAYPGGGVDPRDDEVLVGWAGPARAEWAVRLGVDEAAAQAIVCAAVRETFEESGVLLASPAPDALVSDITGADWAADRAALIAHELSFARFLEHRGLVLRSDLLGAWARWITPEFESRRYDTWFFVAALPAGQRTARTSSEADRTVWIAPADAAERYDTGELIMLPPTITTLRELSAYTTVEQVLTAAAGRDLTTVMTEARLEDGEVVLSWPGHEELTRYLSGSAPPRAPRGAADTPGEEPA